MSCNVVETDSESTIRENTFLIGKWTGNGHFLNMNFAKDIGEVIIEVDIRDDYQVFGKIGEATLKNMTIEEASYGFAIKGVLSSKLKEDSETEKNHLIILLVINEDDKVDVNSSDANFHLKSNYSFDFGMKVGSVNLTKEHN
ncbi:hypothetical protein A9Q87_06525 [Flavobacteriales bacterium 34_180_T64]|nr:hypothetical protein A9Q87_06525 [Flavobacteriales bacterium 34_180_T64]